MVVNAHASNKGIKCFAKLLERTKLVIRDKRGSVISMMPIWDYMHVCISHDYKYNMYI